MQKQHSMICILLWICLILTGCVSLNREDFWIRENVSIPTMGAMEESVPAQTETTPQIPDRLQMDTGIIEGENLRFCADSAELLNDLGFYLQRQLTEDLWLPETEAPTPYSRTQAWYRRLDLDPLLKNEPMICIYACGESELYEVTAILLTHDWTAAGEENFLQLGSFLLQCFWPDCGEEMVRETLGNIQKDIVHNVYPDNAAEPRPIIVYIHGNAAAYGYTHGAHISINVIPVDESRLQELVEAGVQIAQIP